MRDSELFVTIKSFYSGVDAHVAAGLLADNGIEAHLTDEAQTSWLPHAAYALGGVRLQVHNHDVERALELLAEPTDPVCPACGSRRVHRGATFKLSCLLLALVSNAVRRASGSTLECDSCGHRWEG